VYTGSKRKFNGEREFVEFVEFVELIETRRLTETDRD
jgi:hypothetical protein